MSAAGSNPAPSAVLPSGGGLLRAADLQLDLVVGEVVQPLDVVVDVDQQPLQAARVPRRRRGSPAPSARTPPGGAAGPLARARTCRAAPRASRRRGRGARAPARRAPAPWLRRTVQRQLPTSAAVAGASRARCRPARAAAVLIGRSIVELVIETSATGSASSGGFECDPATTPDKTRTEVGKNCGRSPN